jgi:FKBP-type peptidyl-prolyl cis-trans isomerase SlyD
MKQSTSKSTLGYWVFFAVCVGLIAPQAIAQDKVLTVAIGAQVSIEYTLKLDDQSVFDTNVGAEPLIYEQGARQLVPGLEKALEGMKVGESKKVTVQPAEGYGAVQQEAILEIGKEKLPEEARQVGAQVQGRTSDGRMLRARVTEIKDATAILDFNHPLAGKTLHFDVKIVNIQAKAEK